MKKIVYILIFLSISFSREIYKEIRVENIPFLTMPYLASLGIDLDHIHRTEEFIQFAISAHDLYKLNLYDIQYDIIHNDLETFYASRLTNDYQSRDFELGTMGGYYTYDEIVNRLYDINNSYPDLTQLISIGNTLEGRDIWAIKLSDNASIDENEPEVLYTGLHHAREPMSYMNLFYFMDWILENYQLDMLSTHLLDNRELWFIPAINPDGLVYNQSIAPNGGGMQRKNMLETCSGGVNGVDLNRNYSYMWAYDNEGSSPDGCSETYRGNSPFSENETQVVKNFVESHDFPIALNYHSYSNLLIYPLGYEYDNPIPQDDLDIFIEYGEDMVQYNGYELGSGPELLYPVNGEACDWMYGVEGIFAYTPEIGSWNDGFWPATNRIIPLAEENLYPNQFLALVAGSKYQLNIAVEDGPYTSGNSYPLFISVFNQGLSDSNGDIVIEIESSDNIVFELDEIVLSELDSRENLDLGGITYFSPNNISGSVENITVKISDNDGYIYSESIQIVIGELELLVNEDFEQFNNWTVGYLGDDASAGIWESAVPNATYDDFGDIVQPNEDHTINGTTCFLTANGTNPNSPGQSDVDGGRTTLLSPIYSLSEYSGAIVSYWKWYTNNQGNNPGNDIWRVDVSSDLGNTWVELENTNDANNYWLQKQFYLNDYIDDLNNVQFRFIAEDVYYDGDNGSGGSLIEAAIDDFSIQVFSQSTCPVGDLNEDGLLNIQDIVIMVNVILGPIDSHSLYLCLADMNNDTELNVQDIILLLNLILG